MSSLNVEHIKETSRGLRGQIAETIADSQATHFSEADYQLLKFHGTYQQDDRDQRAARRAAGQDKAWSFMTRVKLPGGSITADLDRDQAFGVWKARGDSRKIVEKIRKEWH